MNDNDIILYVIYDHPTDYPDDFVVRRWVNNIPTEHIGRRPTLEEARKLVPPGMYRINRDRTDDPAIVEVWI